jgi:hypothetical protein
MRSITSALTALFVASAVTAIGCAAKHDSTSTDSEAVTGGTEAASTESDTESMSSSFISASGTGVGALALANHEELTGSNIGPLNVGDAAKTFYQPAGCLVVTDEPVRKDVTYVFSDCTGPYGLVHITGTVVVDYSASTSTALVLKFSSTGLKINRATVDWSATANITGQGGARDMIWDGQFSGTTGGGRAFSRTNHKEYKWTVGTPCLSVAGSSDGTVTGKELKIDVINFSRCKFACPEAGSEVKVTDVAPNLVYDVKFNASDATYTAPDGKSYEFHPLCGL